MSELWGGSAGLGAGAWYAAMHPPQAECPTTMTGVSRVPLWEVGERWDQPFSCNTVNEPSTYRV